MMVDKTTGRSREWEVCQGGLGIRRGMRGAAKTNKKDRDGDGDNDDDDNDGGQRGKRTEEAEEKTCSRSRQRCS